MSPGPDSSPGPKPLPADSPPSAGGEPRPASSSEPRSNGPEPATGEAPRRSRSARRRARRRAAKRAHETGTPAAATDSTSPNEPRPAGAGPSTPPHARTRPAPAVPAPRPTPAASARSGSADGNTGQRGARSGQSGRGQRRGGQRQGGDAAAARARRGRLRQVEEYSAGGLVLDLNGEVPRGALIGRTDRQGRLLWSLPKGHIEAGETAEQAAVREVEEETGIAGTIVGELGTIDFWFVADGRRVHKTVRHYLMRRVAAVSCPTPTSRSTRSRGCRSPRSVGSSPTPTSAASSTPPVACWPTARDRGPDPQRDRPRRDRGRDRFPHGPVRPRRPLPSSAGPRFRSR